jgi:hypothetical protein
MESNMSLNIERDAAVRTMEYSALTIILNTSKGRNELQTWGARSMGRFWKDCVAMAG